MTTLGERFDYTYHRLIADNGEQEAAIMRDFLVPLGRGETFPEMVRYFTTRFDDVVAKLRVITAQNKAPGYLPRIENPQLWISLGWTLIERKLPQLGRALLAAVYDFQLTQQQELRRRCYKGGSLQNIGWADYLLGDYFAGERMLRLALIEEVYNSLDMDEATQFRVVAANPPYLMLYQTLGVTTAELLALIRFARDFARQYPERTFYPEDCLLSYLRTPPRRFSTAKVVDFNFSYYSYLLTQINNNANNVVENLVVNLAAYLFTTTVGWELNHLAVTEDFELLIENRLTTDAALQQLGDCIAVVTRYWRREILAADLAALALRARLANFQTIVVFLQDAANQTRRLRSLLQSLYHKDGVLIISVGYEDLATIEKREMPFPNLLRQKVDAARFAFPQSKFAAELANPLASPPINHPLANNQFNNNQLANNPVVNNQLANNQLVNNNPQVAIVPSPNSASQFSPSYPANIPPVAPAVPLQVPPPVRAAGASYPAPPPALPSRIRLNVDPNANAAKPQRLVIRNTTSRPAGGDFRASAFPPPPVVPPPVVAPPPPRNYALPVQTPPPPRPVGTPVISRPVEDLLKPCTSCGNQTSLRCKLCQLAYCNLHVSVNTMTCTKCEQEAQRLAQPQVAYLPPPQAAAPVPAPAPVSTPPPAIDSEALIAAPATMVSPSTPAAILEATTAVQSIEDKAVVEVNEALKEDLNLTLE